MTALTIEYEKRDGVAYITLNNPAKANILDKQTSDEISQAWIDLWEDRSIRCAILTGAGEKHFCGGHNLAPRPDITQEEREYLRTQRIYWPLAGTVHGQKTGVDGRMGDHYPRVWKPVIAAVNGWPPAPACTSCSVDGYPHCERRAHGFVALLSQAGWPRPRRNLMNNCATSTPRRSC
jgi:enoyl-CoA hydratase/carnithine racemase